MTAAVLPGRVSSAAGGPARSSPSASSRPSSSSPAASAAVTSAGRPLLGFRLSCPPSALRQSYHLLDVESVDKSSADSEYRRQKLPHFDCERLTLSGGFQAQPTQQSVATQTAPRQQRAAICQYEVQRLSAGECDAAMASAGMVGFLTAVHDRLLSELDKNRAMDVFKDEFALDDDEDDDGNTHAVAGAASTGLPGAVEGSEQQQRAMTAAAGAGKRSAASAAAVGAGSASLSRPSHSLSLFHSFHHLLYSRQHSVGWVEWHPSRCLVAFSLVPTWNFDQWCDHSGEVSLSYILLYDLSQLLMPLTIVKVPGVVTVFKFHPTQHIVAAAHQQQQRASAMPPATASSLFGPTATPLVAGLQTGQLILYLINTSPGAATTATSAASSASAQTHASKDGTGSSTKHAAHKVRSGSAAASSKGADASSRTTQAASAEGSNTVSDDAATATSSATSANNAATGSVLPSSSSAVSAAASSSSSFLSSLSSTSPADGTSVLPSPLYTLLSNLDRSHGRPVTDIHWLPAPHCLNRKGERTFNPATATATSALFSSQLMSFAADGKVLYWDYRQLNEHNQHGGASHQHQQQHQQQDSEGWMSGTPEEWHEKRDGKWSPIFSLPLHLASGHAGGGADGRDDSVGSSSSSSVPNSFVRTSSAFPVSSLVTARKVALGPSLSSPLLVAVSEDGELLEIDTSARAGGASNSDSSSSHSHSAPSSVLRRCRAHTTVGVSIDRSAVLPSLYASCGESTFSLWHVGGERPVFVSPPCHSASYSAARWSPTRPAVLCLGRTDGVVEVWDCLDATHQPAYTFPTGSTDAITALQFQPAANNQLILTQTQHSHSLSSNGAVSSSGGAHSSSQSSVLVPFPLPLASTFGHVAFPSSYSSSARQYLCAGDAGGKCHIIELPRPLRRRMPGEDAAVMQWVDREKRRGHAQQAATERKSRGLTTATPYQTLSEAMQPLFQPAHTASASNKPATQAATNVGSAGTVEANSGGGSTPDSVDAATAGSGSGGGSGGGDAAAGGAAAADNSAEHEYAATVGALLAALQAQAVKQAEEANSNNGNSAVAR